MRSATTEASRRSPRNFGKILPRLGSPTWWPARPIRCSPLATEPGDSTWITRSTAPMSMPSSSEDVATMARSVPDFSASSTSRRCSRASAPWCARTRSSPASSFSREASRSARRRAFTNTMVERCARISSSRRGWIDGQIDAWAGDCPAPEGPSSSGGAGDGSACALSSAMSSTGTTTSSSIGLRCPASTMVTGLGVRVVRLPAQEPRDLLQRALRRGQADPLGGVSAIASRRSSDRARCAPRLVAARAWISSTITQRTLRRVSRACEVSIR